jgi:LPS sulfotransferase NodH
MCESLIAVRFQANQTELWLRRAIDFRQSAAAAAVTFLDVAYTDLVADPVAALSRVYAAAGLELPADPAAMVERYEHDQPRHARGVHRYTAAQFGLDERGLRERFAFLEGAWG